ncbi:AAA family ATPase [Bifidobacterium sp. SMB2]|uniref:DNA 3'-5' helicase n=1 Tax=Bifidobacterium saimiriisciurei TaxID=2661627 RepID=A0ABX0CI28_9BIFI|nr:MULTISPECIES: UvrD-helicase domain-containing protein [Bifidobacterium]NEG96767.1 AAA family ATPase [Bifidobacterium sp. SMB2]NEH12333.1 AAA family ATPase [Bifidobacterium saimiriisciurei]
MTTFTDTAEQAAVINAPARDDVLVVAGAGSGKTYTMTRRIISLIERGVPAERILGLTFTRKAASELLSRVSAAVLSASTDGNADGDADDEGTAADPDRAFLKPDIFTYDAFFQSIVRQYGLLVGMDQNTQPLSDAGAFQLAGDVVGRHMTLLFAAGNDEDADAGDDSAPTLDDGESDLGAFSTLTGQLMALSHAISDAMIGGDVMTFHDAVERVRRWDGAFIERLTTAIGDETVDSAEPRFSKPPKRLKKDTDDSYAEKIAAYEAKRREEIHRHALFSCGRLLASTRRRELLLTLAEEFHEAKSRANMAEFSDFTIAAFQLVRRFPSIGEEYRRRYSHVFLDEYQDTSTTQATLLAALFHVEPRDASNRGVSAHTAVNAVGDPFQSIYAWRGASPGAFRMFQHDFGMDMHGRPYALSQTRRNSRIVLEAANDLTIPLRRTPRRPGSSLMREVDVAALNPMEQAPLGTLGVQGYTNLGQEIDAVVRFSKQAIALYGVDAETGERRDGTHVAVLFRSKTALPAYRDALEDAGLTCEVVGYSALLERPEVRDLLALLHAVADHTDTGALMRLMATPRFGLGADDLKAVAAVADQRNLEYRYRSLVEAGLAVGDEPRREWGGIVAAHRDVVPNGVFLADVLMDEHVERMLRPVPASAASGRTVSDGGVRLLAEVSHMLRAVEASAHRPLVDVIRVAVEALGLDIDCVVAQSMADASGRRTPTDARASIDAVIDLANTYLQELPDGTSPSLRGFVSWVDALGSVPEASQGVSSGKADVTLMTIHQSKGLEWDAVAVVGLKKRGFPSSQGDHLSVRPDDEHIGGVKDGVWEPPEYRETARTWLVDPTAVPVPIRVDSGILPRFPHDADVESDPIAELDGLATAEAIATEVFVADAEAIASVSAAGPDDTAPTGDEGRFLSQEEEYGRRLHADERRLMYVALTRARYDAMLTFSADGDMSSLPADDAKPLDVERAASNFWMEVHEAFAAHDRAVSEPTNVGSAAGGGKSVPSALTQSVAGLFVGERAQEYENAVVGGAWLDPHDDDSDESEHPWPRPLEPVVADAMRRSARAVRRQMAGDGHDGQFTAGEADVSIPDSAGDSTLLAHARRLVEAGLLSSSTGGRDDDTATRPDDVAALRAKGERILMTGRQNVTAIQARSTALGDGDSEAERRLWAGIVRPIPRVASPSAQAGTIFHDWAARFICPNGGDAMTASGDVAVGSRAAMMDDLRRREHELAKDAASTGAPSGEPDDSASGAGVDGKLLTWQRRLADSRWAGRRAIWAERSIVVAVKDGSGATRIVDGKLDAVFHGGLDPDDTTKRFTIVDWKTGRKPHDTQDVAIKLAQLDMYRLLLSRIEGVPLASIDATLYYLSVDDEAERELHALPKGEAEIISELDGGLPPQSDND